MNNRHDFFEDFLVGQQGETRMRTVGETEIVNFAGITCDYSHVHLAHHQAINGPYGGRIAHGLLGSSLAAGMLSLDAGHLVGRDVPDSYLCGFEVNYRDAIRLGDTIRIAWKVAEKRDDPDMPSFGLVRSDFAVITQDDKPVYDGSFTLKTRKRPVADDHCAPLEFKSTALWKVKEISFDPEKIFALEDFQVGTGGTTSGRTFTEADIVNFAGLTGDYNPSYVDEQFAANSSLKGRIVPAMLVFTSAMGLWARDSWITRVRCSDSAVDSGHLNDSSEFQRPVRIGDTIRVVYRIDDKRQSKSKPEHCLVSNGFQIINQHDEIVQLGKVLMMKGGVAL